VGAPHASTKNPCYSGVSLTPLINVHICGNRGGGQVPSLNLPPRTKILKLLKEYCRLKYVNLLSGEAAFLVCNFLIMSKPNSYLE
jgi:hypothetical protein